MFHRFFLNICTQYGSEMYHFSDMITQLLATMQKLHECSSILACKDIILILAYYSYKYTNSKAWVSTK